jgi:hypothetical protein
MNREAIVSSVIVKSGAVFVNAYSPRRVNSEFTEVPILRSFAGEMPVPSEGDTVIISQTDTGQHYVDGVLTVMGSETDSPQIESEEFAIHFDSGTSIIAEKDGSGNYNLTLNASGDVTIGDAENAVKLAVQNHTHDYDGGGDNSSTLTSSEPNETGTSTTVE